MRVGASWCRAHAVVLAALMMAGPARAELKLPPGFTREVYVTGSGYDRAGQPGSPGVPIAQSLAVDADGALYLALSGNRYARTEADRVLSRVWRIPPGGARVSPDVEARYAYGPPLANPEIGGLGGRGTLWVTTADPDRRVGVLYRLHDGRVRLFAGGTPLGGAATLLEQPEGVAQDTAGNLYVADRARGVVVRLDPTGRLLDAQYLGLQVPRARMLAMGPGDQLWIAGDGTADQPWQDGAGQIWRVGPDRQPRLVFEGPHATGIGVGPGGVLFVAQRQAGRIVTLTGDGPPSEFARFADEQPRALAFGPAGDLFVVTMTPQTWYLNEVIRISGPFAGVARAPAGRP